VHDRENAVAPTPLGTARPKNQLLAGLPPAEFERIRPHLRTLPTHAKQVFHVAGEPIHDVVFINGGVASMTSVLLDGRMIESATVGREGVLGIDAVLGGTTATAESMMQVPDTDAVFMPVKVFQAELARQDALCERVQRFSQALLKLMLHSTACIASHPVQERCCRWLLMTHDRVDGDRFQLSQEFLAIMLGSTRPTVSLVAGTLQRAGLITYSHGSITIVDRSGLEAAACECYGVVRSHYEQLGVGTGT
jgi:CRP-like cAMP-binding protein